MVHSKNMGAAGERELAHEMTRIFHCGARRGQQFSGSPDSPDVVTSIPGVHLECKRTERFQLYAALKQATRDAGENVPIVCHRQNRQPWVAVVKLDDLPRLTRILTNFIPITNESEFKHENHRSGQD